MSVLNCITGETVWIWKDTIGKPHTLSRVSGAATFADMFADRWAIHFASAGTSVFRFTPLGSGSTVDLTITAVDALGAVGAKGLCCVGDSGTTDSGYPKLIKDEMGANITLLGTQGTTFVHEGYPGKDWGWLRHHADSPMTSATDTLDIAAFEATLAAVPDVYTFSFGSNDLFFLTNTGTSAATITSTIAAAITDARDVITAVRAENATADLGILYTFPGALLESTWKTAYPNPTYADPLRNGNWVPIIREWWAAMKTEFDGEEGSGIFLIPTHMTIDTGPEPAGGYPANDPFHFGITVGHPEVTRPQVAWLTANW